MSHDLQRAVRFAALIVLGLTLPAAAVEVAIPRVSLEAGLGSVAAPAAFVGTALPGLSASFAAPMVSAAAAPSLSISAAAPAASPAFAAAVALPASALAAMPTASAAADSRSARPLAETNLRGLSRGIAAGRSAPNGDAAAAAAIAQAFDNSAVSGKADGIPTSWVDGMIAKSESADAQSRRLRDIVQRLGFSKAALNGDILRDHNDKYTVEIPMGAVTNQKQSGRCWLFAGLNMIRSTMMADKTVSPDFEFSENYLHFFNMLEKSNSHLEEVSRTIYRRTSSKSSSSDARRAAVIPDLNDGGAYDWFAFLVSKYGLAPKSAMGETVSSEATAVLLSELKDSLAATTSELLADAKRSKTGREPNRSQEIRSRGMARVWKILATHLGTPPSRFDYRENGKTETSGRLQITPARVTTYTPREFARDFVKFDPRDYVTVSSFPGEKGNAVYRLKNSAIGKSAPSEPDSSVRYLNVDSDRLETLAAEAIKGGQPVYFGSDVRNNIDHESGIMHPGLYDRAAIYQFTADEAAPALTRKQAAYFARIGSNHAMVLTGFDQPDPLKPIVKFKVENSWGGAVGTKGVFHLYREWFHQNVFKIVVHKRFLNDRETGLWNGKAKTVKSVY